MITDLENRLKEKEYEHEMQMMEWEEEIERVRKENRTSQEKHRRLVETTAINVRTFGKYISFKGSVSTEQVTKTW